MRRGAALLAAGLAAVLVVVSAATPQDPSQTHHWPSRTFYIPVNVDRINRSDPKPSHLQLYSSLNRGPWQAGPKYPVSGLQDLGEGKKGFKFTADRDGEYEFSVQYWYASGEPSPRKPDELNPMLSVVIDTTPPVVRVQAGANGVRWEAADDNLDPRNVTLQAKFPAWTEWKTVTDRPFKPTDSYAWKLKPGQALEVRVLAKDRAGNEGLSPVVRVPGTDAIGTAFPKGPSVVSPDWPPTNLPRDPITPSAGHLPQPRIEYVSSTDITVDYTIQKAGRSGVRAAHLYVQKEQGGWQFAKTFPISPAADTGKTLSLKYTAEKQGVYGFYVAPESGAGVRADPPRKDDPPMLFVVVDETDPAVKITGIRVAPGGARGPMVEIGWEVIDQNLLADPINLEYSVDKDAVQWKEIKYRLPPGTLRADANGLSRYVGQYTWEVPDENLWKFYVRIRAVDKAGRAGKDIWKDEVIVDLEKPAAGITGVRGGTPTTSPSPPSSDSPPAPSRPAPPERTPDPKVPPVVKPRVPGGPPLPAVPDKLPDTMS